MVRDAHIAILAGDLDSAALFALAAYDNATNDEQKRYAKSLLMTIQIRRQLPIVVA